VPGGESRARPAGAKPARAHPQSLTRRASRTWPPSSRSWTAARRASRATRASSCRASRPASTARSGSSRRRPSSRSARSPRRRGAAGSLARSPHGCRLSGRPALRVPAEPHGLAPPGVLAKPLQAQGRFCHCGPAPPLRACQDALLQGAPVRKQGACMPGWHWPRDRVCTGGRRARAQVARALHRVRAPDPVGPGAAGRGVRRGRRGAPALGLRQGRRARGALRHPGAAPARRSRPSACALRCGAAPAAPNCRALA